MKFLKHGTHRYYWLLIGVLLQLGCGGSSEQLEAPSNVHALGSATYINLTWENANSSSDYIRVQIKKESDENFEVVATLQGKTQATISDLTSKTKYDVRLQSITPDGGKFAYSEIVTAFTPFPEMENLKAMYTGQTTASVTGNWSNDDLSVVDSVDVLRATDGSSTFMFYASSINSESSPLPVGFDDPSVQTSIIQYRFIVHYTDLTTKSFDSPVAYYP